MERHAYITLLSTPDYLPGVLCLGASLRKTGTQHPLYVALSHSMPDGAEEAIRRSGMHPLRLPEGSPLAQAPEQGDHHWSNTFDKLHLFGLTQFSKLVYLDSDMLILDNIDELFDEPHLSAVPAGKLVNEEWVRLNSGLMVLEPEAGLPERIGATLDAAMHEAATKQSQAVGDQDLINAFYSQWPDSPLQLDEGYNVFHTYLDSYLDSGRYALPGSPELRHGVRPIKVLHFIGRVKPWTTKAAAKHAMDRLRRKVSAAQAHTFKLYRRVLAGTGGGRLAAA